MANTLTNLIPDIYEALDVVSREQVGFIMAASPDNQVARAAQGQTVQVPIYGDETASDITPAVTPPDDGDNTTTTTSIVLNYAKRVPVRLSGKDTVGLNHGTGVSNYRAGRFAQGFRKLANLMEASMAAQFVKTSRAVGVAGTTPFGSGISETALALQVLQDNGAPQDDLRMVLSSAAGANLRSLNQLTKANEAGTDATLRTGALLDLNGFRIGQTGQASSLAHAKGTGTGYLVNSATLSVGDTAIPVDTGTGTIVVGDVITFAGDSNKYIVASALSGGTVTIAAPGLRTAVADNSAVTVGDNYTANMAFARSAFAVASRAPELPEEGDSAVDRQLVTDPFSGLTFEIAMYAQYRQMQYEISLVWGSKVVKPEHTALILG
jgi:hypothetical protein